MTPKGCAQPSHILKLQHWSSVYFETKGHQMSANDIQISGTHYKTKAIQPWDYIASNNIGYLAGNAIKYLSRYKEKGGADDVRKALHYCQKLLEVEYGEKS
jgi:hypothetical protein